VRLTDQSFNNIDRLWDWGTSSSHEQTLWLKYPMELDSLPVILVAYDRQGCSDTTFQNIYIDRSKLVAPNVFTPNNDNNNRWSIAVKDIIELEVSIYNRNGNLVYSYNGIDGYWDGNTTDGIPAPQGAYAFLAKYRTLRAPQRKQVTNGMITLLR